MPTSSIPAQRVNQKYVYTHTISLFWCTWKENKKLSSLPMESRTSSCQTEPRTSRTSLIEETAEIVVCLVHVFLNMEVDSLCQGTHMTRSKGYAHCFFTTNIVYSFLINNIIKCIGLKWPNAFRCITWQEINNSFYRRSFRKMADLLPFRLMTSSSRTKFSELHITALKTWPL